MNNRDLEYFLRGLHKDLREKDINEYCNMTTQASKHAREIVDMFCESIQDELLDRQSEIMDDLRWNFR